MGMFPTNTEEVCTMPLPGSYTYTVTYLRVLQGLDETTRDALAREGIKTEEVSGFDDMVPGYDDLRFRVEGGCWIAYWDERPSLDTLKELLGRRGFRVKWGRKTVTETYEREVL
jgi:hypothetical protein